ncbi:unnamed protein product [Closterium sp. Naga37s-1]|nr:unnamed protein product [Closterium sp. Naga37s-1]
MPVARLARPLSPVQRAAVRGISGSTGKPYTGLQITSAFSTVPALFPWPSPAPPYDSHIPLSPLQRAAVAPPYTTRTSPSPPSSAQQWLWGRQWELSPTLPPIRLPRPPLASPTRSSRHGGIGGRSGQPFPSLPSPVSPSPAPLYDSHVPLSPIQRAAIVIGSLVGALANPARAFIQPLAPSTVPTPSPSLPAVPLYDSHIPLSPLQRAAVAIGSLVGAQANPARAFIQPLAPSTVPTPSPSLPAVPLYDSHIPLSPLQRAAVAIGSLVGAQANPARAFIQPLPPSPVPAHTVPRLPSSPPIRLAYTSFAAPTSSSGSPLYDSHIPLSPLQRAAVAIGASVGALANPARADLVAAVGETTGGVALGRIREQMRTTEEGRAILEEKPRVTDTTLQAAEQCGRGTFGAAYAHFMRSRRFEPHERPPVRFIDDPELAYVATRLREVHDFWHTIFALPTTVSGELALKLIEFTQTGLPMCLLASLGAPIRLSPARRSLLLSSIYPWALGAGIRAVPLAGIYYERRFGEDLSDLRLEWKIAPAPPRAVPLPGIYYERRFGEDLSDLRLEWKIAPAPPRAVPLAGIYYERRFGEDLSDLRLEWKIAPAPPRFFERKVLLRASLPPLLHLPLAPAVVNGGDCSDRDMHTV